MLDEARQLQEVAEPNPRVWNSIEIALRQEGIIHEPQLRPTLVPPVPRRWSMAWLAPVAAAAADRRWRRDLPARIGSDILYGRRASNGSSSCRSTSLQLSHPLSVNNDEDQQLLDARGFALTGGMQTQYASNLQNVNAYIQDAEESAQADPNDEEAQQIVMDAYEQRAAVYEMALDRSLP